MKNRRLKYMVTIISLIGLSLLFIVLYIKFGFPKDKTIVESNWQSVRAVPFSGYICGYEGEETFIQLPMFFSSTENISINDIANILISGSNVEFQCNNYRFSQSQDSLVSDYKMVTLSFRIKLGTAGIYNLDCLKVTLHDGTQLNWNLNDIEINIEEKMIQETKSLSMRNFIINQTQMTNFKVSYVNQTDSDILIEKFSYPEYVYDNISISKYKDFDLKIPEEGLIIPAGQERTFLITLSLKKDYEERNDQFSYILPFIYYRVNGTAEQMLAQTQSTVIQPPFTEDFILSLME